MESNRSYEQKMLISELIHGLELAKQLRCQLSTGCTAESREVLLQGILTSYEKSLLMLKWSGPTSGQPQTLSSAAVPAVPESPLSVNGSPHSEDFEKQLDYKETSKKRKLLPKWTDQVKVCPETGLEGPNEDGYSWRKYGQKDILASKYPRSYYRCTYRNTQNCMATKQVQRSDNDHTVFEITYRGKHTCSLGVRPSTPALMSPEKEDPNQPQPHDVLTKLRSELTVQTDNLGSNATELPCSFPFPPYIGLLPSENPNENFSNSPFISPSTPESNYFSTYPGNEFGLLSHAYRADSGLTDIISGNTSCTNSPILDLDFSLDTVGIDPNFPFDAPGFF